MDEYGVLPRDCEDPIEDAETRPTPEAKAVRRKDGQDGIRSRSYRIAASLPTCSRFWGWALVP